ncbi:MAG TPA: hypothetical protein VKB78_16640, partial [Pirellulales bacterium]|nr:hypothetical protein [Pirellulales bacterium]
MSGARKRDEVESSGGPDPGRRGGESLVGRLLRTMRGRILLAAGAIAVVGIVVVGRLIWLNV